MAKSKQAKAREFSPKAREEIYNRDKGCIFCKINYHMEGADFISKGMLSVMHFIPRSKNGLGIPENGALGCQHHHHMLDNGNEGRRDEMLDLFEKYLKSHYPEWDRDKLIYSKWNF